MMHKPTLRAMLLSGVCLLPLSAMGADLGAAPPPAPAFFTENEVTFGLLGVFGKNTDQFGRYNGFTEEGLDGLFNFSSITRNTWDSGGTMYYEFTGSNLNYQFGDHLGNAPIPCTGGGQCQESYRNSNFGGTNNDLGPNAELSFNIGDQGHWGVTGYYDAISYTGNIIDSIYTPNSTRPQLNNGFPAWGGANLTQTTGPATGITSYTVAGLRGAVEPYQTGTRRDIVGFVGKYLWNDWTITGAVRNEHKEGTLEESADVGYGGNAFTLPVDYDTQRYDLSAAYATPQVQGMLSASYSNFEDHNTDVLLPYATSATSFPYAKTAVYATPPSNDAFYLTGMLGYNFAPETRLNVNARYGVEQQNDTYPANVANPGVTNATPGFTALNSLLQGTSSTSPDLVAQVFQGNASISSSPISNLNTRVAYSVDTRHVSLDQVGGVLGSGSGSEGAVSSTPYAYVVPQDWLKQKVQADADYLLASPTQTKLEASFVYNDIDRSNAQVGHSNDYAGTLGMSSMLSSAWTARISGTYGDKSGVMQYWVPWSNLSGSFNDETPSGAYYQAPKTYEDVSLRTDYSPGGAFSGGLQFKWQNDDYHYPNTANPETTDYPENLVNQVQGITHDYNLTVGVDGNYRPSDTVNFHAYYTYEEIFYNNTGNGACAASNTGNCLGSAGYFQNKYTNGVHTVGLSTEWQATERLKLSADYTFSYGAVMFGQFNGVWIGSNIPSGDSCLTGTGVTQTYQCVASYPDENTVMNTFSVKANYQLSANTELALMGGWSMFRYGNWQDNACTPMPTNGICSGASAGSTISILTPGYTSPNYNVGMLGAALKVKW